MAATATRGRVAGARASRSATAPSLRSGGGRLGPRTVPVWAELVRSGAGHAVSATLLGLTAVVALVLLGWATADDPASSWQGVVRVGAAVWLLAHLVDVSLGLPIADGGSGPAVVSLTPLGATAALVALHVRTGWRLARLAAAWRGSTSAVVAAVATAALTSGALALVVAVLAGGPGADVAPLTAGLTVATLAAAATTVGTLARVWPTALATLPGWLSRPLARWLPAATGATVSWLTAAAVVATASLVVQTASVVEAHAASGAGGAGGAFLLALDVALVPNLVVWAGSVLAGPGLSVGPAALDPSGSTVADVPGLPVLVALGPPAPYPLWAWAGVLVVVASGGLGALLVHRQRLTRDTPLVDRVADATAIAVLTGCAAAGVAAASGGAVAGWGPVVADPLRVGAAVAGQVGIGALAAGAALHLLDGRPLLGLRRRRGGPNRRPTTRRVASRS